MKEVVDWLHSVNLSLYRIAEKLERDELQVLLAAREIYEVNPEIEPIHIFWTIREKLRQIPDEEKQRQLDQLARDIRETEKLHAHIDYLDREFARAHDLTKMTLKLYRKTLLELSLAQLEIEWLKRPYYIRLFEGPSELGVW